MCEAVGLEPGLSDDEVLRRLPELESKIAKGEKRALSEDPKYLRKLVSSHRSFPGWVGRRPEAKDYAELDANGKPKRFKYLNHDPGDNAPSPYVLLEDALIRFRTAEIHKELEIIDLPGLGAHVSIDTILSGEFLDDLDGALVFVSVKARSDEVAEKVVARLRQLFRGDFSNRLWLVLTNFDSLGEEFVKGKGSTGDTGFDGVARLGSRFGVLDPARDLRQVCLVSNHLFRYGEFEDGRLRQRAAATAIGFPAEPAIPPQVAKYSDLVPAYQELFVDGGISWLRRLLREELVPLVSARLRDTIRSRLRDVVRRLQPPLELARKHRGEDLLPDVQRCLEAVFQQVRSLESRTDLFDQPALQLRGELRRQFQLRFAPGEFNDARPLADVQQRFPGDAQALEDTLAEQFRMRIVPNLYALVGARLQEGVEKLHNGESHAHPGKSPLDVPIAGQPGVLQAWEAFGQEDAGPLAGWVGTLFPSFVDPRLFAGMQPRDAEQLNGRSYRALMEEKVKVTSQQAMHVLRSRLVQRLRQLEQALDDLTKIADSDGTGTTRVDYDELLEHAEDAMPINMTVRMKDVWRRVGVRKLPSPHRFTDPEFCLRSVSGSTVGVCFHWPKAHRFLALRAWWNNPGEEEWEFVQGGSALEDVFRQLGVSPSVPEGFLDENEIVAAVVPRTASVRLLFCIDTDDEAFRKVAEARPRNQSFVRIAVGTYVFDAQNEEDPGEIQLELEPARLPDRYAGYLAIDLGNSSSTLAAHPDGPLNSQNVWIVDGEAVCGCTPEDEEPTVTDPGQRVESSSSAVRIDLADAQLLPKFRDHPACFVWAISKRALDEPSSDGVILGAKRLLAGRDYDESQDVRVWIRRDFQTSSPRTPVALPRRISGELLLCRLLQRFRESILRQVPRLALTYPTSYSRREMQQLREVVSRALSRLNAFPQTPDQLADTERQVHRMLDEASAAAFFFLFRDVLETPPGLLRFRYLYPNGCNVLLCDCGGGTTDVGLVRASVDPHSPSTLRVDVKGRSGVRDFGGDDITIAVFRLLKTQLAKCVKDVRGGARTTEADDALVPTRYDRQRMNNLDRSNRDNARSLWQRALDVKHRLETVKEDGEVEAFGKGESFDDPLSQTLIRHVSAEKQPRLRDSLLRIRIRRKDVDALVRDDILRGIDHCNRLIRKKLANGPGGQPEEVHRFILLGNGSRYPLVPELLRQHLSVLFFDERLEFDRDNLKTAVAKGAVLALATELAAPDVRIDFDWSLCERLPFDVGYPRLALGGKIRLLFQEGELYDDIAKRPETVEVLPPAEDRRADRLPLLRRWPGEDEEKWSPYLEFYFRHGIEGAVTIEYDPVQEFQARDSAGNVGELIDSGNRDVYLHPVERGTL